MNRFPENHPNFWKFVKEVKKLNGIFLLAILFFSKNSLHIRRDFISESLGDRDIGESPALSLFFEMLLTVKSALRNETSNLLSHPTVLPNFVIIITI